MTERVPLHPEVRLSRSIYIVFFAAALLFLYLRTFLFPAIPFLANGDQALFFVRAARIAHGQVLYRDFFELVTPGTELLYAAVFRLFGIHVWIMQAWGIVLGLALLVVITRIASRMFRGLMILLPGFLFLVFDYGNALDATHHWYSTLAVLAAVSVLTGMSLRRIFTASIFCGVATLFTQTQGVLTLLALMIFVISQRQSENKKDSLVTQLATLVLPFTALVSCVLGYYVLRAGFSTVYFDLVVFPLKYLSSDDPNSLRTYLQQLPPVHRVADTVRLIPFLFVYAIVPYIYVFGGFLLWRRWETVPVSLRKQLVLFHLVGFALFLSVANGPRFVRLCTVAPPAVLICAWILGQPNTACRLLRNALCILAALSALWVSFYRQTRPHVVLNLPIGRTAFLDIPEAEQYQWLAQHTHPSEFFFNDVMIGLYLGLDNAAASDFVNHGEYSRPEQVANVIQSLKNHPAHFVLLFPVDANHSDGNDNSMPFQQYVHDHYHLNRVFYLGHNSGEELWELTSQPTH